MNKRIGILGGTFDPIHNGHLYMAQSAYEQLNLDEVVFIPTGKVPHKDNDFITDSKHRYNMVCLAVKDNKNYSVSDMEIKRNKTCYTYETVMELANVYPDDKLFFIVGADSVYAIDTWMTPSEIFKYATMAVINRDTDTNHNLLEYCKIAQEKYNGEIVVLDASGPDISSTEIRNSVKNGHTDLDMLPSEVYNYIRENKLYIGV